MGEERGLISLTAAGKNIILNRNSVCVKSKTKIFKDLFTFWHFVEEGSFPKIFGFSQRLFPRIFKTFQIQSSLSLVQTGSTQVMVCVA